MIANRKSTTDAAEEIVEAALALGSQIWVAVDEMELERHLPPALVEAMQQGGVFRGSCCVSSPEAGPLTQVRIVEALSLADSSVGWGSLIGTGAGYFSAFNDQVVAREMYPDISGDSDCTATVRPGARSQRRLPG